jgi:hypothetical protein
MSAETQATIDAEGFGGHTALFSTVVSQTNFWMNHRREVPSAPFTQLLLEHGANPNARASLRKQLHPGYGIEGIHVYRDITPARVGRKIRIPEAGASGSHTAHCRVWRAALNRSTSLAADLRKQIVRYQPGENLGSPCLVHGSAGVAFWIDVACIRGTRGIIHR